MARVNGANSGALYVQDNGNINGYNKISKPENHMEVPICRNVLFKLLPPKKKSTMKTKYIFFVGGRKEDKLKAFR